MLKISLNNLLQKSNKVWKLGLIGGLATSLTIIPITWAGNCSFGMSRSDCRCDGGTARVGRWNHTTGRVMSDRSAGVNVCVDENDNACRTVANVTVIGTFAANTTKYFVNTTVTPKEYFKCTYTRAGSPGNSGQFNTAAHTPPTPPTSASINSIAGLIFVASGFLLLGTWVARRKTHNN